MSVAMRTKLLFALLIGSAAFVLAAEADRIGLPCVGAFEEVTFQRQQLAIDENQTPAFINIGPVKCVEKWIAPKERQVLEGRLSKFKPPQFIVRNGKKYEL